MNKERPILFNGDMVRAILGGRKTQTRRIVKASNGDYNAEGIQTLFRCPFGQPGDRLWVRETWKPSIPHSCAMDACDCASVWVDYLAGGDGVFFDEREVPDEWLMPQAAQKGHNVPAIHMPRWASRITLEITAVRVERLQDISEEDAKAEGFDIPPVDGQGFKFKARHNFKCTWEKLYSNWDANPWVWVVEFKKLEQNALEAA